MTAQAGGEDMLQHSENRVHGAGPGLSLAVGAAICFGMSGPLAKTLTQQGWSTGAVVLTRLGVAAVVAALAAQWIEPGWWRGVWRHKGTVGLYGLVSMAVSPFCFFNAAQHMSVGVALMLEYLSPVAVIGWIWASTKARPSTAVLAGAGVALVGAVTVLGVLTGASIDGVGVLWALGAASAGAAYFILGDRFSGNVSPASLAAGGLVVGAAGMAVAGATGLVPLVKGAQTVVMAGSQTSALVPLVVLGFVTGLAYPMGVAAISRLRPAVASVLGLLEIPVAVLAAWLALGESLTGAQLAGAAVLLGGVALTQRQGSSAEGLTANEPPVSLVAAEPARHGDGPERPMDGADTSEQEFLFTAQ